jgi:DNA-binding response OmpR family regulator
LDSIEILEQAKALHLGTKQELLGVNDRSRLFLCAIFERNNKLFPVVAFVLTRVLPLINEYPASKRNHFSNRERRKLSEQKSHATENNKTILIVDDDPPTCRSCKQFLDSKGFKSHIALSAEGALSVLKSIKTDIVITGINMPGMNGLEFTRLIKNNYDSDVIILTGNRETCTPGDALRVGAGDLLYKPAKLKDLLNSVKRILYIRWSKTPSKFDRPEEALKAVHNALELNPDDSDAWDSKGIALGLLGRFEEALKAIDKALELDPNNFNAWNRKGMVLNDLDRHEEALQAILKALELKPDDSFAWYLIGIIFDNLGDYEEAQIAFRKSSELENKIGKNQELESSIRMSMTSS